MVLEGRWWGHGRHHVPSQQKWHMTGFGWNGVILGSCNNEMNERTAPYNQKTTGVFLISQYTGIKELFLYMGLKVTSLGPAVINCAATLNHYSEHVTSSTVHTHTKIRKKQDTSHCFKCLTHADATTTDLKKQKCTPWSNREDLILFCLSANVL